jgi:hypothetical protein
MTSFIRGNRTGFGIAIVLAGVVSLSLAAAGVLAPLTAAALAVLLSAATAIALNTWRNGQATGSMGQLLHDTEQAAGSASASGSTVAAPSSRRK